MLKSRTRWIIPTYDELLVDRYVNELNIPPLVAKLLMNRELNDIEQARDFLFDKNEPFHDPFLFNDMKKAINRIQQAIKKQEPILVFGDYDADGVSSTTVMLQVLKDLGADADFYIPNRFTEGYGPNEEAFQLAKDQGFSLIITVDTGIAALNEAALAKKLGIDLIITDHHEPGPELPDALAIIHPKTEGTTYPFPHLAGVGVAFKVAHALYGHVPEHLLDVAAIGTIADLVPLVGENRAIAKRGLRKLRTTNRLGVIALCKVAGSALKDITEETVGFAIAPRINAIGRLGDADPAVDLLMTEDKEEAKALAEEIDSINKERQTIVSKMTEEAIAMVENHYPPADNSVLIIGKEGWNSGVVGIVASRLVEKFYRPTIVLSYDSEKGMAKGSARSIVGFDLFKNLSTCKEILPHFGGHPMAAGMTLGLEDVDELRNRLNQLATDQLTTEDFIPVTLLDAKVELNEVDLSSIEQLQLLAPFGMNNPKPKLTIENVSLSNLRKIGSNQNHLKITLNDEVNQLDGVGFGMGEIAHHISPNANVSVIGELAINEWNNIRKPQIFLQDLEIKHWQLFDVRGLKSRSKWLEQVPTVNRRFVVFQPSTLSDLGLQPPEEEILLVQSIEDSKQVDIMGCNLILIDLPSNSEYLHTLLDRSQPDRIYAHFYQQNDHFFSTFPTRDHFKWYYGFLAKRGIFNLNKYGNDLAKHRGWTKETIEFMSQVFFELDFVTINNGLISLNPVKVKRDFEESSTYCQKQGQFTLENELLYSSYQELKAWFEKRTNVVCKV
jgi:single-stranded-DNA-specific exonuclease